MMMMIFNTSVLSTSAIIVQLDRLDPEYNIYTDGYYIALINIQYVCDPDRERFISVLIC